MRNKHLNVVYQGRRVGRLAETPDKLMAFEYDAEWLSDGFAISPFKLPLEKRVFIARRDPFDGNFGVFDDSLPDGWGRLLVGAGDETRAIVGLISDRPLTPSPRESVYFRTTRTQTTGNANSGATALATAATSSADTSARTGPTPNVRVRARPSGKYPTRSWNFILQDTSWK